MYRTSTNGVAWPWREFRMPVRNMLHAACSKYRTQKNRYLGTIAQLCRAICSQLRHVSTIGKKNLLNSNTCSTCPDNMVNFGPLAAEISLPVWGTPANFNGFRVLAALLHGTIVVGVSQTAALNRGRHLYSVRWPSRWALAHILVNVKFHLPFPSPQDHVVYKHSILISHFIICLHHFMQVVCCNLCPLML